jgi:precorrin-2/cobalt-factor-2 C20-methyltransferase
MPPRAEAGRLIGIGVGPGDPELLTLKGLRLLQMAAVVAYPAPESGDSFARGVVARWLDRGQREIALRFPMRPGPPPAASYDAAATALAAALDAGDDVALICQGDPLFYGSFIPIWSRLSGHYRTEIVPGVSSLTAGAAAAQFALASRDDTLSIVPATLPEPLLEARLAGAEAAVVLKLGRHLAKLRRVLARLGRLDRALYVERASLPQERVLPFAAVAAETAPYFSLALVPATSIPVIPAQAGIQGQLRSTCPGPPLSRGRRR